MLKQIKGFDAKRLLLIFVALLAFGLSNIFEEDLTKQSTPHTQSHTLEFKNHKSLDGHYKKHGINMGYKSAKQYLEGARKVVATSDVLTRTQDDKDTAYFLPSTGEFVVVSPQGIIRTFFIPEDGMKYFNKQ